MNKFFLHNKIFILFYYYDFNLDKKICLIQKRILQINFENLYTYREKGLKSYILA